MAAIQQSSSLEVDRLLHQGADPNARDTTEPPHSWREILRYLMHPVPSSLTDTALMSASRQGDLQGVQRLLAAGAQTNAVNGVGETALTLALAGNRADIMLVLLAHGANPNVHTIDVMNSPIPVLIQTLRTFNRPTYGDTTCRTVVASLLDHGADVHAVDANGDTALLAALDADEMEVAQWLILKGSDLNHADKSGDTPLHESITFAGSAPIRNALLQRGADVMPERNGGWNMLCWAAEEDDLSLALQVIQRGLKVNSRDKHGRTPLMYAASKGAIPVFNLLLAHGADVNACDDMGWTALMFAAQSNDLIVVNALLRHGADRRLRDQEDRWTAAERASHVGQERTVELLKTWSLRGEDVQPERLLPAWGGKEAGPQQQARVDAHRWIKAVHVSNIPQEGGEGACGVVVVDADGKRGKPFGGETFFFLPDVQGFHDTDGSRYAFIKGHHRSESNFIVAVRGRTLVQRCEYYAEGGVYCQPLPAGGVLVVGFERTRDRDGNLMEGLRIAHQHDLVAEISRFRLGKLTSLGLIYLPEQEE